MATQSKKLNRSNKVGKALAIGAGVAALGSAAYLLFGPNSKKNQKKVKAWAKNMQSDVEKSLKQVKNLSKATYAQAVDAAAKKYSSLKDMNKMEVLGLAKEMKSRWDDMTKGAVKKAKSAKRTAKKVVKKAVKNAAKKAKSKAR